MDEKSSQHKKSSQRMPLIAGLIGISLGIWLFMEARGMVVPDLVKFWPAFIGIGAVASFFDFVLNRTPASLGKGVFGTVLCATAFMLTFGVWDWSNLFSWLPAIPFGAGLGLLACHGVSDDSNYRSLIRGTVLTLLGGFGWLPQFPQIKALIPSGQIVWAGALIILGLIIVIQQLRD